MYIVQFAVWCMMYVQSLNFRKKTCVVERCIRMMFDGSGMNNEFGTVYEAFLLCFFVVFYLFTNRYLLKLTIPLKHIALWTFILIRLRVWFKWEWIKGNSECRLCRMMYGVMVHVVWWSWEVLTIQGLIKIKDVSNFPLINLNKIIAPHVFPKQYITQVWLVSPSIFNTF